MKILPALMLVVLALSGCAYRGGDIDNPVGRKFSWFSFVEGGDLRATCRPGAPDRYRLVYNGVYDEQVRIYELGDGANPRRLSAHVVAEANLLAADLLDPLGPWRGRGAELVVDADTHARLVQALAAGGAFGPPDAGLELPSRSFYWTAAACHRGAYHFNAWRWPSPEFRQLRFPEALFALDRTGVPVNPPRPVPDRYRDTDFYGDFNLRVGERGLFGVAAF